MQRVSRKYGFTIVELLIAAFIGMLSLSVLFYVSLTIQNNINVSSEILGITQTGRLAANWMMRDIREASEVKSSYAAYGTGNTTLVLDIPVTDSGGIIIGYDVVVYALDAPDQTKIRRIVYAAAGSSRENSSEIIAQNIKGLLFSANGVALSSIANKNTIKAVTADVTTAKTVVGLERSNEVVISSSLRNKK